MRSNRHALIYTVGGTAVILATGILGVVSTRAQPASDRRAPPESRTQGKTVYDAHCVECHGQGGQGNGPAALMLAPRPRDFTAGQYTIRTTETGSIPTDDDVIRSVRYGLYGTAMPGWDKILSDAEITAVVAYVKTLSSRFAGEQPRPVTPGAPVPNSPQSVARGRQVYDRLRCGSCHGTDGRGAGAITTVFKDDRDQALVATDLTEPWTFHGGSTARDLYLRFRTGMTGTPMPSFADAAKDAEMWDLANYVGSLARKAVWSMNEDEVKAFYAGLDAVEKAHPVKRGEYLVSTMACVLCHSPIDEHDGVLPGMRLAGGMRIRVEPFGEFVSFNLTSDRETGLGNWTDNQIKQVITRGVRPDGSRMLPYPMDWPSFSNLKPDDVDAIVAYLRTVPPVSNRVPKPTSPFLPMYLWGKFRMLILGDDLPLILFYGNAGAKGAPS